jgi:hypothetical protein
MNKITDQLKAQLSTNIDPTIIKYFLDEYVNLKTKFFLGDSENTIKHSGRFVELLMAAIKFIKDNIVIDLNKIEFRKLFEEFEKTKKLTPQDDLLYLALPRVARTIYTLRSKKKVAHFKLIDPNEIDASYIVAASDWILASLLFLFHTSNVNEITILIRNLVKKQIPLIEEFEDGDILVLEKVSFREEMLLILHKLGKRIDRKKLFEILNPRTPQVFTTTINDIKNEKFVHENVNGIILTSKGIEKTEEIIVKYKQTGYKK